MDLLSQADIARADSGSHFVPDSVLIRLHPGVLFDASKAYAKMVEDHPNYEFGMVQDPIKGGVTVYWNRVA